MNELHCNAITMIVAFFWLMNTTLVSKLKEIVFVFFCKVF